MKPYWYLQTVGLQKRWCSNYKKRWSILSLYFFKSWSKTKWTFTEEGLGSALFQYISTDCMCILYDGFKV